MKNNNQSATDGIGTIEELLVASGIQPDVDQLPPKVVASLIDHTLLKPGATASHIDRLCDEAIEFGFKSVCVNPVWVPRAAQRLDDSNVKVCTVVGFPLGASSSIVKAYETKVAVQSGADEIDMVINIGALKFGELKAFEDDMRVVVAAAAGRVTKVILETCLLRNEEKRTACATAIASGIDFVKTSTGFSEGGATAEDIVLMRDVVQNKLGVKASGGVRCFEDLQLMVRSGATRIGTSAGAAILQGTLSESAY